MVNVIASGSRGNCTAVKCGETTILLDLGINFERLQQSLNFENPAACLITHEHGDHVNKGTLQELLKNGVEVFMTLGTAEALNLEPSHRLHYIQPKILYEIENISFYATPAFHDAAEPVYFKVKFGVESVSYITDTGCLPPFDTVRDYLIIEVNHSTAQLMNAEIDEYQKRRILQNHLSIEKAAEYIGNNQGNLKEVHLIHISKRHGNAEQFKQIVQKIVGEKVPVIAH